MIRALIFDVDGTLAETEEAHRAAFNLVFARAKLGWSWGVDRYRDLLRVTGGKERIARYLAEEGLALAEEEIVKLHRMKNAAYAEIVRAGGAPLRPGISEIIADARAAGLKFAICTTTSRVNIETLLDFAFAADDRAAFSVIVSGEDVGAKKPAPDAYVLALRRLGLQASQCLAFEDSRNGVEAAIAAGIPVVVCPSLYSAGESFRGALAVHSDWRNFSLRGLSVPP